MLWYILQKFQIREQSSFLNVLYHNALETKVPRGERSYVGVT